MTFDASIVERSDLNPVKRVWLRIRRFFDRADRKDYDAERAQAVVRFIVVLVFNAYMMPIIFGGSYAPAVEAAFLIAFLVYMPTAALILWWVITHSIIRSSRPENRSQCRSERQWQPLSRSKLPSSRRARKTFLDDAAGAKEADAAHDAQDNAIRRGIVRLRDDDTAMLVKDVDEH
jgi:hypothetical protein